MSLDTFIDESTLLEDLVDGGDGDWDDDLVHICCDQCEPRMALCGGELDDESLDSFGDDELCVVCLDLAKSKPVCPTCGEPVT